MLNVRYDRVTNEFVRDPTTASPLPQVMWHVTDVCPLGCPYCFATKTNLSFTLEQAERVLSVLSALGVQKIDIGGGEPLTWSGLSSVARWAQALELVTTLTTTGVGSIRNRQWLLANAHQFARIIVSLDAPDRASHDTLRSFPGAFDATCDLLDGLHSGNYGDTRINTVVTAAIAQGSGSAFARLICALGPREWCLIQPHPANEKETFRAHVPSREQFDAFAVAMREALSAASNAPRLLIRTTQDYSGYWVLYPGGLLKQHTEGAEDRAAVHILDTSLDKLRSHIMDFGVSLPGVDR